MEVPRLGVKLELQLPAYTTATAMRDLSRICNLYHGSWQRRILNPLSKGRDRTATSWFLVGFVNHCATTGTPNILNFLFFIIFRSNTYFIFIFLLFRATPVSHGSSQARGLIRAVAASLHHRHSNARSKPHLQPTPQLTETPDPLTH